MRTHNVVVKRKNLDEQSITETIGTKGVILNCWLKVLVKIKNEYYVRGAQYIIHEYPG